MSKKIPHADFYVLIGGKNYKDIFLGRCIGGEWYIQTAIAVISTDELSNFLQNENYHLVKTVQGDFGTPDILVFVDYKRVEGWEVESDRIVKHIQNKRKKAVYIGRRWGKSTLYQDDVAEE